MSEIQPGAIVLVRAANDEILRRRATTGQIEGGDFLVVWICSEREWQSTQSSGREPEGIPWPAEDVRLAVESDAAVV